MQFYTPAAFLFLLTVPAIVILYLLKQRHQDYTVSSLHLWSEVLRDMEANAPWQKLRRNILMILQIVIMVLCTIALARPFLTVAGGKSGNYIVLLDKSMSMQAEDVKPNRFEAAKRRASSFISNLSPGTMVTLITIGGNALIEENQSRDRNSLIKKLNSLKVTNSAGNADDAAGLVQSIVKQYPGTVVVLYGDSRLEIPGVEVLFNDFSQASPNYAILMMSHAISENGITVLARIANYSSEAVDLPISLYVDDRVFDARNVRVKPGETVNVYWNEIPKNATFLQCRIDSKDFIDADNIAWDVVNPVKTGKVMLVSDKNIFLEKVISLMNNIRLFKTIPQEASGLKGYDLYIFDGVMPEKLPSDGNIIVFNPPSNNLFEVTGDIDLPQIEKSRHELLKYVSDFTFSIGKMRKMTVPAWAEEVLASKEGPVIFAGTLEKKRIIVFGFDLHNSDIALKPAFPILMTNSFEWLVPTMIKNVESIYPGQNPDFNLDPEVLSARVITPLDEAVSIAPPFPAEAFSKTGETGLYLLEQKTSVGLLYHYFTVNVPAAEESDLGKAYNKAGKETGKENSKNAGAASGKKMTADAGISLKMLFLWLAAVFIIIEWWVYSNGV